MQTLTLKVRLLSASTQLASVFVVVATVIFSTYFDELVELKRGAGLVLTDNESAHSFAATVLKVNKEKEMRLLTLLLWMLLAVLMSLFRDGRCRRAAFSMVVVRHTLNKQTNKLLAVVIALACVAVASALLHITVPTVVVDIAVGFVALALVNVVVASFAVGIVALAYIIFPAVAVANVVF